MVLLHNMKGIVYKIISIAMLMVSMVAIIDLGIFLTQDLGSEHLGFFSSPLIEMFGLFLNSLMILELLENLTVYLEKNVIQVESVIGTFFKLNKSCFPYDKFLSI